MAVTDSNWQGYSSVKYLDLILECLWSSIKVVRRLWWPGEMARFSEILRIVWKSFLSVCRAIFAKGFRSFLFSVSLCLLLWIGPAWAEKDYLGSLRSYGGQLFNVPVYDPNSRSYFELRRFGIRGANWSEASRLARSKIFKGVRGRLAVIRSRETNEFIVKVIRPPDETWIGLRLFCKGRKLFWVDGRLLSGKDYKNWGRRWHYPDRYYPCKERAKYAGIGYVRYQGVPRWWAMAPAHRTRAYLVQYPTGKE